jgi:hypothetical protein
MQTGSLGNSGFGAAEIASGAGPVAQHSGAGQPSLGRKVLFSAMKNEAPFVLEWIAYHKVIGFDEIVICSNPSNDGMEELLAALAAAGEIRHLRIDVAAGESPQQKASRAFTAEVGYRSADWYLWLDADEFLNVHAGDRTVSAFLDAIAYRQFALINWRIFGSAGQKSFPGRFVSDAFICAAAPDFEAQLEQKTLFRYSAAVKSFGVRGINRPLLIKNSMVTVADMVVGTGKQPVARWPKHKLWLRGADTPGTLKVRPDEFGWKFAQINHYIVRTPEFFALKRLRGRGYQANAVGPANDRHTDAFFVEHDRNEAEDRSILHWEDRVTEEIARLMRIPGVAEAKARSDDLVRDILADLGSGDIGPREFDLVASEPEVSVAASALLAEPAALAAPAAPPDFRLTFPRKEAKLVRRLYAEAKVILEYGSGGSTVLGAELGKRIISVESDKAWADRLTQRLAAFSAMAEVHHVDIGPTEKWGMSSRPRFHVRYHRYPLSVWDRPDLGDPDIVLLDGRFRAACLVAVMLRARRPTTVLIDDYIDRPYYHRVEALATKEEVVGRMARFTVTPGTIPPEMMTEVIGWFADQR